MTLPDTEWDDTAYGDDGDEAQRDLADQLEEEAAAAGDALEQAAGEQPQLYFKTLPDFVEHFLIKAFRRHIPPNAPWCSQWWKHGEAVCPVRALARLGSPPARTRHRHERVVARPLLPPHGQADGPQRHLQELHPHQAPRERRTRTSALEHTAARAVRLAHVRRLTYGSQRGSAAAWSAARSSASLAKPVRDGGEAINPQDQPLV